MRVSGEMKHSISAFPRGGATDNPGFLSCCIATLPLLFRNIGGGRELEVDTETWRGLTLRFSIWNRGYWGTTRCSQGADVVCV